MIRQRDRITDDPALRLTDDGAVRIVVVEVGDLWIRTPQLTRADWLIDVESKDPDEDEDFA